MSCDAGDGRRRRKVLLVDDSALVLRIASAYLSEAYDVVTGSSGEEALSKALAERPDVILMDMHMGGRNGAEAADCLQRDRRTHDIPVVIMSTAAELALLPSHLDYLTKPFDKQAVLAKLLDRLGSPIARPVSE